MKIKLTESQYRLLESYLTEARQEVKPTVLSSLFDKNPSAKIFTIIQRIKGGSDSEYFFKLEDQNGHKMITDINVGTKTKGCSADARFDTMIYGNKLTLPFGKCGTLNLNNVIGIKLYGNEEDANSGKVIDSMEFEHDFDTSNEDLLDKYYDILRYAKVGQEVYFDSKFKWDGEVTRKAGSTIQIELVKHGINESINEADMEWNPNANPVKSNNTSKTVANKKPNRKSINLNVDLEQNPFYEENGNIMFKANSHDATTNETKEFIIPIKKFTTSDTKQDNQQKQDNKPKQDNEKDFDGMSDEELVGMGQEAMDMILNNPELKQAFYKHPSFMNLFVAGLKGKKAPGTGILPTLQLLNRFGESKTDERFIPRKTVEYIAYGKPLSINPYNRQIDISTDKRNARKISVKEYSIEDKNNYTVLEDGNRGYKITVKEQVSGVQDVFICDIYVKPNKDANFEKQLSNVKLQMLPSNGYRKGKTSKTQPLKDK